MRGSSSARWRLGAGLALEAAWATPPDCDDRDAGRERQAEARQACEVQRHEGLLWSADRARSARSSGRGERSSVVAVPPWQRSHLPGGAAATRSSRRRRVVSSSVKVGGLASKPPRALRPRARSGWSRRRSASARRPTGRTGRTGESRGSGRASWAGPDGCRRDRRSMISSRARASSSTGSCLDPRRARSRRARRRARAPRRSSAGPTRGSRRRGAAWPGRARRGSRPWRPRRPPARRTACCRSRRRRPSSAGRTSAPGRRWPGCRGPRRAPGSARPWCAC